MLCVISSTQLYDVMQHSEYTFLVETLVEPLATTWRHSLNIEKFYVFVVLFCRTQYLKRYFRCLNGSV